MKLQRAVRPDFSRRHTRVTGQIVLNIESTSQSFIIINLTSEFNYYLYASILNISIF